MIYVLLLAPIVILILIAIPIMKIHRRIDELEDRIAIGHSSVFRDIYLRLDDIEKDKK